MGRKVFAFEELLASADVNDFLMDQSVPRFASVTERDQQWPTPPDGARCATVLAGGMVQQRRVMSQWLDDFAPYAMGWGRSTPVSGPGPLLDQDMTGIAGMPATPIPTLCVAWVNMAAGYATASSTCSFQAYTNAATNGYNGQVMAAEFESGVSIAASSWSPIKTGVLAYKMAAGVGNHLATRIYWSGGGLGLYTQADVTWAYFPQAGGPSLEDLMAPTYPLTLAGTDMTPEEWEAAHGPFE